MDFTTPPPGDTFIRKNLHLENLRVTAQDTPNLTVQVSAGSFWNDDVTYIEFAGENSLALTKPLQTNRVRLVVVGLDLFGNISLVNGTDVLSNPDLPTIPVDFIPLAAVLLQGNATTITNDIIYDIRQVFSIGADVNDISISAITGLSSQLTVISTSTAAHSSSIAVLFSSVSVNQSNIVDNISSISALQTSTLNLEQRASVLEASVGDLNTRVSAIEVSVSSNVASQIGSLDLRVSSLETSTTSIDSSLLNINTSLVQINANITDLENSVTNINASLVQLHASVNANASRIDILEIGGSAFTQWTVDASGNLIPNTGSAQDLGSSALPIRDLYMSGSSLYMGGDVTLFKSAGNVKLVSPEAGGGAATDIHIIGGSGSTGGDVLIQGGFGSFVETGGTVRLRPGLGTSQVGGIIIGGSAGAGTINFIGNVLRASNTSIQLVTTAGGAGCAFTVLTGASTDIALNSGVGGEMHFNSSSLVMFGTQIIFSSAGVIHGVFDQLTGSAGGTSFPLAAPDGSASGPSYSFSSDSSLGMWRDSATGALNLRGASGTNGGDVIIRGGTNSDAENNEGAVLLKAGTDPTGTIHGIINLDAGATGSGSGAITGSAQTMVWTARTMLLNTGTDSFGGLGAIRASATAAISLQGGSSAITVSATNNLVLNAGADIDLTATNNITLVGSTVTTSGLTVTEIFGPLYDIAGTTFSQPTASAVIMRFLTPRAFTIPSGFTDSRALSGIAASGAAVYNIKRFNSSAVTTSVIGTITWAAASTNGIYADSGELSDHLFVVGDVLSITAPGTADDTHDELSWTVIGTTT